MSDVLAEFGYQVREARTRKGWKLEDVAREAFANPDRKGYVSQIENGRITISPRTVGNLARVLDLPTSVTAPMLRQPLPATDEVSPQDRNAEQLLNIATRNPTAFQPAEALLIALAYTYAPGSEGDLVSASNGLRAALDTAGEMQRNARLPHNAADQVDAVLAELDALNAKGELDAGAATLTKARAAARDQIAQQTSGLMRLLDSTVAQARLRNAPQDAADALVEKLLLDTPPDIFNALLSLEDVWYESGRDQCLSFESTVAIHLAEHTLTRAQTRYQRGAALNNLGNALQTLGQREPGTARLDAAVAAFTEALKEYTRDRLPLDWAMIQNNLGTALATLGDRESNTAKLDAAVFALNQALKEHTRDRVPLNWALTQNNLGTALEALGRRVRGTTQLEAAIEAHTMALKEWTLDRVPLDWATAQNNLGNALQTLGKRESDSGKLEAAVIAYTKVLKVWTRSTMPMDWAMAHNNLGTALRALGERELGTVRLDHAVSAFTQTLKEWTRERVPLDWATTQNNLGIALANLGEREPGTTRLDAAVAAFTFSLDERTRARVPLQWAATQANLSRIALAYFDKTADRAHLTTARTHALAAREVFTDAQAGHYLQIVDNILAEIATREAC